MPIHEFMCEKCHREFEFLVLSDKEPGLKCPRCRSKKLQKLMSAGSVRSRGIPSGSGGFAPPKCAPAGT